MSMRTRVLILVAILTGIYLVGKYLPNDPCPARSGKCEQSYAYVTRVDTDYAMGRQGGTKVDSARSSRASR